MGAKLYARAKKKYLLVETYGRIDNAGSKAKNDAVEILQSEWQPVFAKSRTLSRYAEKNFDRMQQNERHSRIYRKLRTAFFTLCTARALKKLFRDIERGSVLLVQFPFVQLKARLETRTRLFLKLAEKKQISFHVIIHDLDEFRSEHAERWAKTTHILLSRAEAIYAHNQSMKRHLCSQGISGDRIKLINFFPYLHSQTPAPKRHRTDGIAFAGNLMKSPFFTKAVFPEMPFNIYGYCEDKPELPDGAEYFGVMNSFGLPSIIKGGWGLVWTGGSVETCDGKDGAYLRYNSPHKCSLYLVARMPLIAWKESALAPLILEEKLGIAVGSLKEIPMAISKISDSEYEAMLRSIEKIARKLETGQSLIAALQILNEGDE